MQTVLSSYESKNEFLYIHSIDDALSTTSIKLHHHSDNYEILLYINGNSQFHVEGTVYFVKPYDIVSVRNNEMHIMSHQEPLTPYERIIINVKEDFFIKNGCEDFKRIFTNRPLGVDNLIASDFVLAHNIPQIMTDMEKYIKEETTSTKIVLRSKLIELLYNLNILFGKFDENRFYDQRIKNIVLYINEHLASPLSLDHIANHFFQSKYHICHIFKQQTGMTINQYIIYKRLLLAKELYLKGKPLIDASLEAGFGSYSTFYKLYTREMGQSPQKDLLNRKK